MYLDVVLHYLHSKQATYVQGVFQPILKDVIESEGLDLEVDPVYVCSMQTFSNLPLATSADSSPANRG